AASAAVAALPGIGYARQTAPLVGGCEARAALERLICNSLHPGRAGDIFYGPARDSVVMSPPFEAATHGSANDDDRWVPVLVLEPAASAARIDRPVSSLQVAPTLARILGVPAPPAAREPALPRGGSSP